MMHLQGLLLLLLLGHPFTRAASKKRPLTATSLIETGSAVVNSRDLLHFFHSIFGITLHFTDLGLSICSAFVLQT
jgi:hypothetical protein